MIEVVRGDAPDGEGRALTFGIDRPVQPGAGIGGNRGAQFRMLFLEQPLHRDVALITDLRGWPDHPPVIIDESDAELASFPRALKAGYAGTSFKSCKGIFKGIANACLARARGRVKSREQLIETIAERNYDGLDRSIDVHIWSLRRKLGDDPKNPSFIRTVRAVGYMLINPDAP